MSNPSTLNKRNIVLSKLRIENFKGCGIDKAFNSDFYPVTNVFGANASGKTTLVDAFTWLLFDKDSSGAAAFDIRPLSKDGNTVDKVEILVEAVLMVDDEKLVLTKRQNQKWVKKRGTGIETMTGNNTTYEINSFPASEKEFKEKVAGIAPEDLFNILTNPFNFVRLHWKKQREILFSLIGKITDDDVLSKDQDKYAYVSEAISWAGAAKVEEKAKDALKKLATRQGEIPSEINGMKRQMTHVPDLADLELHKNAISEQLDEIQEKRNKSSSMFELVASIQSEIMKIKAEMDNLERKNIVELREKKSAAQDRIYSLQSDRYVLVNKIKGRESIINELKKRLSDAERNRERYADQWRRTKSRSFNDSATICETCGQKLPPDRIEEIEALFEEKKKADLEQILEAGYKERDLITECNDSISKEQSDLELLRNSLSVLNKSVEDAKAESEQLPDTVDMSQIPEYAQLSQKLHSLKSQLDDMSTQEDFNEKLRDQEAELREELDEVNRQFAKAELNEKIQDNIEELESELRSVSQQMTDQEHTIFLLEEFARDKTRMLDEKINSMFNVAEFKFFEVQVNGGIRDICEMGANGVPYRSLNSAAKMQVGLDVINVLSNYYGIRVPVWLDNRESVSAIPDMDCQIINLFVSPVDQELRIEDGR